MSEKKIFSFAVAVSLILAVLSLIDLRLLFSSLVVDYSAVVTLNKTVSLSETFNFHVKKTGKYSMLYRNWKVPIIFREGSLKYPFILVNSVSSPLLWYVVDYAHNVYLKVPDEKIAAICKAKAYNNEIGIVKGLNGNSLEKFKKGEYKFSVSYLLYPPVETDGKYSHLNIKLADSHVFYPTVKIFIKDPKSLITVLYVHMTDFSVKKVSGGYIVEGKSPENSLIELEMVLNKPAPFEGFYRKFPDVSILAKEANRNFSVMVVKFMDKLLFLVIFLFPLFMVYYYFRYGSELSATVPEYISFIPDKNKKPYIVNMLFAGDATSCDENGFYATLLDLKRKGLIDIKNEGNGVIIEVLELNSDDPYEKAVLSFLKTYSENVNGKFLFIPERLKSLVDKYVAEDNLSLLRAMKKAFDTVFRWRDDAVVYKYLDLKGYNSFKNFAVFAFVFLGLFVGYTLVMNSPLIDTYKVVIHSIIFALQLFIFMMLPPQILGRWRERRYKEYLLWKGFRNFLSDMVMLKKYAPEDIAIWKEWLIYGTALGVADKVEKAMEEMNISIPEIKVERGLRTHFGIVYAGIGRGISSLTKSSSGGGGFGAGGGFGGGGAGGR